MATLVTMAGALPATEAVALGRRALDRALEADAELSLVELTTEATVLGAFQRHHDAPDTRGVLSQRASGGPFVLVGPGTLHVLLLLAHPSALVACSPRKLLNRYVRPLLRGLTRSGALAHYFGREWISVAHHPVGQVGFAHDSRTRRAVFEAFVAVRHGFAPDGRASFLGKTPATLEEAANRTFEMPDVMARVAEAYGALAPGNVASRTLTPPEPYTLSSGVDPPWSATVVEAIGNVAAGVDTEGTLRLGGDLLASRDAVERVAARVAALPSPRNRAQVGAIVDDELGPESVALDGVRDLASVREVLLRAAGSLR